MASSEPPPPRIEPDSKDWTWVLEQSCPECGFDARTVRRDDVASMLRDVAGEWNRLLTGSTDVRERTRPDHWSILEYACHVRDVCRLYLYRLELMLGQDGPHYPNWDQDATAAEERYDLADPAVVTAELTAAAADLADRFDSVTEHQWERTGYRSDGAGFTVESFALYFIHDPVHHLHDVR